MANKTLFRTNRGRHVPSAKAVNEAGGAAYRLSPEHALAQYAATGCMNSTFYASAQDQLETVIDLCSKVEPEFIAKVALYSRREGAMKDLPALLCAMLSVLSPGLMAEIFDRVIDSPKMLRNYVQIMRSGVVARKSMGTLPKRLVRSWLESRSDESIFYASVGNDPSLADIVKMVHPKPSTRSREALYGYMLGRDHDAKALPEIVREYEAFKAGDSVNVPDVPFQMLTSLPLDRDAWIQIARNGSWHMTRMNLNTFARHGALEDFDTVRLLVKRLSDPELIKRAKVLPYQLLTAHSFVSDGVPRVILQALEAALDISIRNVPKFDGKTYVFVDVSGSMHSSVTGFRKGATSTVRCIDVAGLIAASVLRVNPDAEVIPFHDRVTKVRLNPRDTVMTNARTLANMPMGGTNCSAPLAELNRRGATADTVIYVSDSESWIDTTPGSWRNGTRTLAEWEEFKTRSPGARMVCIDMQPYATVQAPDREDILNVGGFSDSVFDVISAFAQRGSDSNHWCDVIDKQSI